MEELIKRMGFDSLREWQMLVANVPGLTDSKKLKAFEDWKDNDGTKEGLLKLYNETTS
jgi:hypothetical protein